MVDDVRVKTLMERANVVLANIVHNYFQMACSCCEGDIDCSDCLTGILLDEAEKVYNDIADYFDSKGE